MMVAVAMTKMTATTVIVIEMVLATATHQLLQSNTCDMFHPLITPNSHVCVV